MAVSNKLLFSTATSLFAHDVIDEGEFVAVYEHTRFKSPEYQYWNYEREPTAVHDERRV